ncbi:non-ribosomal peptide synthetase [Xenorhabdus mauleonii]|uniref:non-ribosomal peptide synthetase n=1 Tax=Xenorhabdus mauleonii TaxID=351675 RepID=UPI0014760A71|nr:non-ribosomal peptide synthetase [Xenorhabdus mauleonii]
MDSKLYELHPAQEDVFNEQTLHGNASQHNLGWYTLMEGDVDIVILQQTWQLLYQHVDMLRLRIFINSDNKAMQYVKNRSIPESMIFHDFSTQPDPEEKVNSWMQQQINQAINFPDEILYQISLIRINRKRHYLFTKFHHIIIDGVGLFRLHEYIHKLYNCLKNGESTDWLSKIPQYSGSMEQAKEYLYSPNYDNDKNYWHDFLTQKNIHQLVPHHQNRSSAQNTLTLPFSMKKNLYDLCKKYKTNILAVFSSLVTIMMAELTGQQEVTFNTITHGRKTKSEKYVVGMQANIYPVYCHISDNSSMIEQIKLMEFALKESYYHSQFPYSHLVRLANNHGIALPNIFIFYERLSASSSEISQAQHYMVDGKFNTEPIIFRLQDFGYHQELTIAIDYLRDYFNEQEIKGIFNRLKNLLLAFLNTPSLSVSELPVLLEEERHTLLYKWNQNDAPYPQNQTLQQQFEKQVAATPDNVAVIFEDKSLTYRQLNGQANQLAIVIREYCQQQRNASMQADTPVALYLNRSLEMVVSILAVLKAGGAYVPISPEYPPERVQFILQDTGSPCVLTQQNHLSALEKYIQPLPIQPVLIATDNNAVTQGRSMEDLLPVNQSTDLAYIIYTSGTTGQPKGVALTHKNVINHLSWMQSEYPLNTSDKVLQQIPYTFDASVWELLAANWFGASIVMASPDVHKQPEELYRLIQKTGVTVVQFVPSMLGAFCQTVRDFDQQLPSTVRYVLCGGETLTMSHVNAFRAINNSASVLINLYGPTETTNDITHFDITDDIDGNIPIGKAHHNTRLYVLNHYGRLAPIGSPGELYIGGASLARGYWNRPELTAERFVENPFATDEDKVRGYTRLYKTGDRVRWLPDGNLEYLGRNDFQVKIRGYRIELGEIEAALTSNPLVKQAVVIDRERAGHKVLAAYLVSDDALTDDVLVQYLANHLPEYMIPASFTRIDAIPLTVNGKLDRHALPIPVWENQDRHIAPRTELETRLSALWQEILGVERVGIEDNFFHMGGDSIIGIQLVSKLRQHGFSLQVKSLFEAPTVSRLAQLLNQTSSPASVAAEQGLLSGEFGLLPVQQDFFNQNLPSPHHWNQAFMIRLPGTIKHTDIAQALARLVERHDILRAYFVHTEQGYHQCYSAGIPPWLPTLLQCDIRKLNEHEQHQQLTQWQSSFHYCTGPLWQAAHLTGYPDGNARLFFAFHHLIIDAVSWRIITEDMRRLLQGQTLPAKTSSYRQWVVAVQRYAIQHQDEVPYWQDVLGRKDAYPLEEKAISHQLSLPADLTGTLLREANLGYHTEINDLLLSALTLALQATFSRPVHPIILEGHGRENLDNTLDVSETVGWFTTLYPVRLAVQGDIAETIIHTKEMLRAVPNKGIGYGALFQAGYLTGNLPAISFNYLGQLSDEAEPSHQQDWSLTYDNCGLTIADENSSHLLLDINGAVLAGKLQFSVLARLSPVQTQRFITAFEYALNEVIAAGQKQARLGGVKTPSDYGLKTVSIDRLNRLQQRFQVEHLFPATSLQQGFIYHHLLQPQDDAYRVQMLLDYHTDLDLVAYQQAWALASLRFPILRTAFDWDGEVLQIVTVGTSIGPANFAVQDISQLPEQERNNAIDALQQHDRTQPFDLNQPGLIRFTVIRQHEQLVTVLITQHHCISDGWSGPILLQAVHEYYNALVQGQKPQAVVEQAYLATQQYHLAHQAESDAFWAERKAQFQAANDLSPLLSHRVDLAQIKIVEKPAEQALTIEGNAYVQLKNTCRTHGITLNVALQFAWHKLLHNYTGDKQTIVGTTVSGRDVPVEGIESSVGLYINTLPLAVQWNKADSILNILQNIQQDIAALNNHSAVSLSSLQSEGERLFHSLLVFENYPAPIINENGKGIEHALIFRRAIEKVDYPLSLIAYELDNRLIIKLNYGDAWLADTQAQRLLCQLERILLAVASDPNQLHASITFLSEEERHTLLHTWNQTDMPYPQDKTLPQLFETQVEKTPDIVALVFAGEKLTYRQLNQRANQLAVVLREQYQQRFGTSLPADTPIALYLDRSLEMVISILAVLKAGGAYVPISPEYPAERVQFILTDTAAPYVITQQQHLTTLAAYTQTFTEQPILITADDQTLTVNQSAENPVPINTATDLAYIIYTSGTTGQPKGVMIEHKNVVHLITAEAELFNVTQRQKALMFAPYVFDGSAFELFPALLHGLTLYICSEAERNAPAVAKLIQREGIEIATLSPALLNSLMGTKLPSLQRLVTAGESPSLAMLDYFRLHSQVLNAYGPTEITVCATEKYYQSGDIATNIGKAIPNARLYVLDGHGNLSPIGAAGELYIGGAGLARGYLNQPQLTAERFVPNPFATAEDKAKGYTRLYKTGDLVRWLPNGELEFLGRNDFQVKIRGYRIELGEIENALISHPQVTQAVVIDREHQGNKLLAAYLVAEEKLSDETLIEHLSAHLPAYMLPASFTRLDAIPLTLNGKLDRRALPAPTWGNRNNYVAPRNALETQLCSIWQDVLGLERVGIEDNFFRIGGDSIISIKLVSKLRLEGFSLQVQSIVEAPTVSRLAYLMTQTCSATMIAEQGLLSGEFDLLPIQQDFFNWNLSSPHHWNQAFMIRLPGNLSYAAVRQALSTLIERHDMLRAHFIDTKQGHRQCYPAEMPPWLPTLLHGDISKFDATRLHQQLTQWQNNFDYYTGPLWQAAHLIGYPDGSARLFFAFHHLIIDAVSWRIIAEDMRRLLLDGTLPEKTSSYRQWVHAVRHYAQQHQTESPYWQKVMAGYSVHTASGASSQHKLSISTELTDILLHEANLGYHTEINDLLLSALTLALPAVFSQSVNHIALEGHGRENIDSTLDISETVGWFTTFYPVRLEAQADIAETIIYTKEMLRAVPNKGIGYGALRQAGYLSGDLPTISFNYLGQLSGENEQDWSLTNDDCGNTTADEAESMTDESHNHWLLSINGLIRQGRLQFSLNACLTKTQTQTLITAFEQALNTVIMAGQKQAQSGGIKTSSDYGVNGLSGKIMRRLQHKYSIEALYPATSLQQGFIYHYLTQPQDDAYRVQLLLDYHTHLDLTAYQQAWALASLRFPILRTAFDWESEVLQIVTEGASIGPTNFTLQDISQLPEEERDNTIDAIQQYDRTLPFDLNQPGLIRFTEIRQHEQLVTVLITQHHCISDGWSNPILLQAVHEYYNALVQRKEPQIVVEQAYLATQQYHQAHQAESDAFWAERKAHFQAANDLSPLLSHRVDLTQIKTVEKPDKQAIMVEGYACEQLKNTCRTYGVTLNVALQFAWHKLLHSYTGDEQTMVGTTVSGRDVPVEGIESSVGLYINTLPLAVQWNRAGSIVDILQNIQRDIAALSSHSAVSLSSLQSDGERLFHSLLVFENYPTPALNDNGEGIEHALTFCRAIEKVDYPLSLIAYEHDNRLTLRLSYGETWLTDQQAQRLLYQLERILLAVASGPNQLHTSITFLSDEERYTLLHAWNQTDAPYPQDKTLPQLFAIQAEKTPDTVALVFAGEKLTYHQLNQRANQLAVVFREQYQQRFGASLPADTPIALYLDRSLEMVISILAVLKAGGAYVPISPEYPAERVQFILVDTAAPYVITQQRHLATLAAYTQPFTEQPILIATDDQLLIEKQSAENPVPINNPADLAYIIYTSGTTGQPKGVMVEHKSVTHLITAQAKLFDISQRQKALMFAPYVFDGSAFELFPALLHGLTLYICSEAERNAPAVAKLIQREGIEIATLSPSLLNSLMGTNLPSLQRLVTAGESPSLAMLDYFRHHSQVMNAYGPTEATVCATEKYFQFGDIATNIGKPIPNARLYVLDGQGNLSPIGAPGELYIGGAGLARGYLNQPQLTAERFVPNSFATAEDKAKGYTRLYKTGDLVRWLPNGELEFLGRNDFQVKIRGYRIELGEIENVLISHSQVKQAIVIDREHQGSKLLAAYLVAEEKLSDETLFDYLSARLPEYMLPASFTRLDTIPLTLNGKLDRRALPAPIWDNRNNYIAPRNALEAQLCSIWQDVLSLERVGIEDNFFRIGGNSLLAIKLTAAIENTININIPLTVLFNCKSISLLSQWLEIDSHKFSLLNLLTPESTATHKLFMVHAANCGSEVYKPLANALSDTYNCIGIDNYNFLSDNQIDSLHQIAQIYKELILQETSIDKPIRILGWSLGGQIAMEIAFQLEQLGAKEIQLFLLDTIINNDELTTLRHKLEIPKELSKIIKRLQEMGAGKGYIDTVLRAIPSETGIANSNFSGKLIHTKITLFKAGQMSPYHQEGTGLVMSKLIAGIEDNNISQWLSNPLVIKLVDNYHHENMIEAVSIISAEIINALPFHEGISTE